MIKISGILGQNHIYTVCPYCTKVYKARTPRGYKRCFQCKQYFIFDADTRRKWHNQRLDGDT